MGLSLTVSALLTQNHFITTADIHALSDNGDAADGVAIKRQTYTFAKCPLDSANDVILDQTTPRGSRNRCMTRIFGIDFSSGSIDRILARVTFVVRSRVRLHDFS